MAVDDSVPGHRERVRRDPEREAAAEREVGLERSEERREALRPARDEHVEVRRRDVEQRRERLVAVASGRPRGGDDADALVPELAQERVQVADDVGDAREKCDAHCYSLTVEQLLA